jgi:hypothetical protein
MKLTALQKRAVSEGVEGTQIENAMDGDSPKEDIIALLLQHLGGVVAATGGGGGGGASS